MVQISASQHLPVQSKRTTRNDLNLAKTPDYIYVVHDFWPETDFDKKNATSISLCRRIECSLIAPSSEE